MEHHKTCTKCRLSKPTSEFFFRHGRGQHYARCKVCFKAKRHAQYLKNKDRERAKNRIWWAADAERRRKVWREAATQRRDKNPGLRLHLHISNRLYRSIVGHKAGRSTLTLLGYTRSELMAHLERQFLSGMTWGNYGQWHVDHIVPLSSFQIAGVDDPNLKAAWALTNLRPLWAAANLAKRDRRTHLL